MASRATSSSSGDIRWSILLLPFSQRELRVALGQPTSRIIQEKSYQIEFRNHPYDHLDRHRFFTLIDVVEIMYNGKLNKDDATNALAISFPEDAFDIIELSKLSYLIRCEEFRGAYHDLTGYYPDAAEAQHFLRIVFALVGLLQIFLQDSQKRLIEKRNNVRQIQK